MKVFLKGLRWSAVLGILLLILLIFSQININTNSFSFMLIVLAPPILASLILILAYFLRGRRIRRAMADAEKDHEPTIPAEKSKEKEVPVSTAKATPMVTKGQPSDGSITGFVTTITFLLMIGVIGFLVKEHYFAGKPPVAPAVKKSEIAVLVNPNNELFDEECSARASLVDEGVKKVLVEKLKNTHPILIPVACRESGFRQNGENGEVLTNRKNSDGTIDYCALQINSVHTGFWKKLPGSPDPKKLEDCIEIAKAIHDKLGVDHWFPSVPGSNYGRIRFSVPVSKEYQPVAIQIPKLVHVASYEIKVEKPCYVEVNGREVLVQNLNKDNLIEKLGMYNSLRIRSDDGSENVVTITFSFYPVP